MLENIFPTSVKEAALEKGTVRTAKQLDLSSTAMARVIGFSEHTISRIVRRGRGIDPLFKVSQMALFLILVFRSLEHLVGSDERKRSDWLTNYKKSLNGHPNVLIETPHGLVTTLVHLDGMRGGVPP